MEEHELTDGNLWLTRPTYRDIDRLVECCQEPSIAAWVTIPKPYYREHAENFLDDVVDPGWLGRSPTWALRRHADGPVIGMIGLGSRDASCCEIGYWLMPQQRSLGVMSRAVAMVCDFGFRPDGLALARIGWRAFTGNHASAAVVRRNGFRYEGMARLGNLHRGVRRDSWLAGRLATDPPGPADGWPQGI